MTIAVTGVASGGNGNSYVSTLTVTRPATTGVGDAMYFFCTADDNATGGISNPGWTTVANFTGSTGLSNIIIQRKFNPGTDESTYTAQANQVDAAWGLITFSGVDATTPEMVAPVVSVVAASATLTAPSVSPALPNGMMLAIYGLRNDNSSTTSTPAASSGMTEQIDTNDSWASIIVNSLLLTSAGPTGTKATTLSRNPGQGQSYAVSMVLNPSTSDTTSPTAATLTATAVSSTQVNLSWSGATDNVGVVSYNIIRGNTTIATGVTGTTYSDTTVTASSSYNYTVTAVDAAGNVGPASNTANAVTPAASGTSTITYDFTGTTGATWAGFTLGTSYGTPGSITIQNNAGRIISASNSPYATSWGIWTSAPQSTDCDFTGSVVFSSSGESYFQPMIGVNNTLTQGFTLNLQPSANSVQIGYFNSGGFNPSTTASFTFPAVGTKINWRLKRVGSVIYGRVWLASVSEPTAWTTSTDFGSSASGAGYVGVAYATGNDGTAYTATVDDLSYTYPGASGPVAPTMPNQVSGIYLYTTSAGTQVFKYEVQTSTDSSLSTSQKQAFLYVPSNKTSATTAKFCFAAHGLGDDPGGFMQQASITDPLLQLLMDNGYVVIVPAYDATLGNADGQARLARANTYLSGKWTTAGSVLFGFSMGGATSSVAMHRGTIPGIKAVQLVSPVLNFADAVATQGSTSYEAQTLYTAYNTDSAGFAAATAAWDPARQPASKYAGQRWRINSATNDGYTWIRPDAVSFIANQLTQATQAIDIQVNGGHGTAGQFVNPDQMIAFYEAAVATPTVPNVGFGWYYWDGTQMIALVPDVWDGTQEDPAVYGNWDGTTDTSQNASATVTPSTATYPSETTYPKG